MIYTRIFHRFWSMQPVMHVHDIRSYFIWNPYIVEQDLPVENRYTNEIDIKMSVVLDLSAVEWQDIYNLVRHHFLPEKFRPPLVNDISCYFHGHNGKCYISTYRKTELLQNTKIRTTNVDTVDTSDIVDTLDTSDIVERTVIKGCMTSRPLHLYHNGTIDEESVKDVHYIDYLCVAQDERKMGIAQQLIQTHFHLIRRAEPRKHICLFKREGAMTGIVPLCTYVTECYNIRMRPNPTSNDNGLIMCNRQNFIYLVEFLKSQEGGGKFGILMMCDYIHLLSLIENGAVMVCMDLPRHVFFFRQTWFSQHGKTKKKTEINEINEIKEIKQLKDTIQSLGCFGSICNNKRTNENHSSAFANACNMILLRSTTVTFTDVLIERISDNIRLNITAPKVFSVPTAYFFYNYACPTIASSKVLIII